ncbi:MAG: hypothetical protein CMH53_05300 [Myxococcales bacterium]|nr:hypothetical protein [Myxococcales bacterium]
MLVLLLVFLIGCDNKNNANVAPTSKSTPTAKAAPSVPGKAAKPAHKPTWRLVSVNIPKRGPTSDPKVALHTPTGQPELVAKTAIAMERAWTWAKTLDPNPMRLRNELAMPGKKHFVEYLALLRLMVGWSHTPDELRVAALARAHEVLAWTDQAAYHDMGEVDDRRFRQDSMSYLRAALIASELGWDIGPYRAQIQRISQRLQAHMTTRGVDQQMSFEVLYDALGLAGAPSRAALYPSSKIARLINFKYWISHPQKMYEFTHEVFAMTGRGARSFPFVRPVEGKYARKVAYTLLHIHMTEKHHDGVAELLANRVQLGAKPDPQFRAAREFLLTGQDAQGRFGVYDQPEIRKALNNPRYDAVYGGYVHTTMVALWALMLTS